MKRWLPQLFGGVSQPGNRGYQHGKLGTLLESPGLRFVANLDTTKKKPVVRPTQQTSWYHIRNRLSRRRSSLSCQVVRFGPPLPPQEEVYAEYMRNRRPIEATPVRRSSLSYARELRDQRNGFKEYQRILSYMQGKRNGLICTGSHRYWTKYHIRCANQDLLSSMRQLLCTITFTDHKGRNIVKRRYRKITPVLSGDKCDCHSPKFFDPKWVLPISKSDNKPAESVAGINHVRIEVGVDDELEEMGLHYEWGTGELASATLAADYGSDPSVSVKAAPHKLNAGVIYWHP